MEIAGTGTGPAGLTSSFNGEVVVGTLPGSSSTLAVNDATLNATGFLSVGRGTGDTGVTSTATFTRAAVSVAGVAIGSDGGVTPNVATQSVTLVNSSLASGGDSLIGDSAGSTGSLVLTGTSTFTSDNGTRIGNQAGAVGSIVVSDTSTFTTAGWLAIGNSGSGSFTARDRAVVNVPVDFNVADLAGSVGTLSLQGSAAINAASVYLGKNESGGSKAVGTMMMSGGTFAASGTDFLVGRNGDGSWTQSGGTTTATSEVVLARFAGATGALVVSGGSFTQSGTGTGLIVGFDGTGTLTVSGSGSVTVTGTQSGLTLGNFGIGTGTVSLDGGTLTVPYVRKGGSGAIVNLNGGVLRAGANARNDFLSGLDSATVLAGGARFDTNGTSVTIAQSLADGGGGGGLVKQGAGTLVLAASNGFTGATVISGGTLALSAAGSIAASSTVAVAAGATFDVTSQAGGYAVPATQTIGGNGTVNGSATFAGGATLSPGASPGALAFTQGVTFGSGGNYNWQMLSASGTSGSVGGWDLVTTSGVLTIASTSADRFNLNLWTLSGILPDVSGSATNFNAGQNYTWKIASASGGISGFAANKFAIRSSATNGTGGFANALGGGTFSIAQNGNDLNLVFTASGTPTVITINVASGTQTQSQAGYPLLTGSTPVLKTGGGTLIVDQANTLSGSTTVQAGRLQLANGAALGSSKVVPLAGGTMTLAPYLQTTVGGLAPNAGGLVDVGNGMVTVAGGLSAADMVTAIVTGLGDGSWNGTSGITSSVAAASGGDRTVGWLDNGDGTVTFAFAAAGDTNLDWQVDIIDAANFLAGGKFDSGSPASWNEGDFTYDGVVDILDAASFLSNGLFDAGPYNPPSGQAGAIAAVPEPSTWTLLAAATALTLSQLRRRRRVTDRPPGSPIA